MCSRPVSSLPAVTSPTLREVWQLPPTGPCSDLETSTLTFTLTVRKFYLIFAGYLDLHTDCDLDRDVDLEQAPNVVTTFDR